MKYIKIFESARDANTWWDGNGIIPNVVLVKGDNYGSGIHYNFQGLEF